MTVDVQAARQIQTPACDRCTQGVMDATNSHYLGLCQCRCHESRPRPDFDPRIDYPERYTDGPV